MWIAETKISHWGCERLHAAPPHRSAFTGQAVAKTPRESARLWLFQLRLAQNMSLDKGHEASLHPCVRSTANPDMNRSRRPCIEGLHQSKHVQGKKHPKHRHVSFRDSGQAGVHAFQSVQGLDTLRPNDRSLLKPRLRHSQNVLSRQRRRINGIRTAMASHPNRANE